jgi:uncharacterized Zn-finger protein
MHTNYRPHKCESCGKGFAMPGELKNHLMIHSGERPYPCDICAMRFQSQGNMRKHRANIHKDAPPFIFPKVSLGLTFFPQGLKMWFSPLEKK